MVALVNLDEAAHSLNMWDENLVRFGGTGTAGSTAWSYATPSGHSVDMRGLGLQYDAAARPVRGLIKSIGIDAGGAAGQPSEVAITGLVIGAPPLDDSPAAFWDTVLRGATTIDARLQSDAIVGGIPTRLFGDDLVSATSRTPGTTTDRGYDDTLLLGSGGVFAQGDVKLVSGSPNGDFARYVAGDDFIRGAVHTSQTDYAVSGDAFDVGPNASLIGGSDTIRISDSRGIGFATGDAVRASSSFALAVAGVFGGDDRISGFSNSRAELIGDVRIADRGAEVHGGDDLINGSNGSERMAGDIMLDVSRAGNLLICGDDRISGGGGNDVIAGDVFTTVRGVFQAGDDVLSGGFGSDWIFGETASNLLVQVTGGHDQLSGGDGDDLLYGQSGDDILDGGRDADRLDGGVGRDVASYASARAGVSADLADAEQNSGDAAGDVYVAIEDLQGSGFDDHLLGNSGSNRLSGGAGADVLEGRDGMDTLDGGAGDDRLAGGAGVDTFVFAPGYGRDRVLDFADATDLLDLTAFGFTSFNEVMARASETRATGSGDVFDLVIDVGDGSQLTIEHFRIADFDASDVLL